LRIRLNDYQPGKDETKQIFLPVVHCAKIKAFVYE
jgi:hypothetical protein